MGNAEATRADNEHKILKVLGDIATAIVGDLKTLSGMLGAYADSPQNDPLSERFATLQRAAAFCGYWSVASYLGAMNELAQVIERESSDVVGRIEFIDRVKTLGAGIQTLGSYLQDVAKGVNASNGAMNEMFRVIVRKCRPELLDLEVQDAKEVFFMPVPLSLEIEAAWLPDSRASHGALIKALQLAVDQPKELKSLAGANPYPGLSGFFESLASQSEFLGRTEMSDLVREEVQRLVDLLSPGVPIVGPSPDSFLFSRLLYAAAHNLSGDEANQRFRKRYALLSPALMSAVAGAVSMHGLAKEFAKGIQKIQDAYQQANLMRSTARIGQMAALIMKESAKIGFASYEQLALLFEREALEIVRLGLLDDAREKEHLAMAGSVPGTEESVFTPGAEVSEAWIRGAQVLSLLKEAVETWNSHEAQASLLAVASRANFDGVIDVSRTMQVRSRDLALVKVAASLNSSIASLKTSIDTAMRQAHGRTLESSDAAKAAELIGNRAAPVFDQVHGVMEILGLPQAAEFATHVSEALRQGDKWVTQESRTELFELITRYGVFTSRLRPGTLIDLQPEEAGLNHFGTQDQDEGSIALIFDAEDAGDPSAASAESTVLTDDSNAPISADGTTEGDETDAVKSTGDEGNDAPDAADAPVPTEAPEMPQAGSEVPLAECGELVEPELETTEAVSVIEVIYAETELSPDSSEVTAAVVEVAGDVVGDVVGDGEGAPDSMDAETPAIHDSSTSPESPEAISEDPLGFDLFAAAVQVEARSVEQLSRDFLAAGNESVDRTESLDHELATVMFEETQRCLTSIFDSYEAIPSAAGEIQEELLAGIKREIHTLKGACRTVGLMRAGSIFHSMEDELDLGAGDLGRFLATLKSFELATARARDLLDEFQSRFSMSGAREPLIDAGQPQGQIENEVPPREVAAQDAERLPAELSVGDHDGAAVAFPDPASPQQQNIERAPAPSIPPSAIAPQAHGQTVARKSSDETVRLPLSLVAQVGNASGSVLMSSRKLQDSIDRLTRIERSLDTNIRRMTASMRELEILAAARITASTSSASASAGFDPLELDRYTSLQEVVRTLSETHQDVLADLSLLQAELRTVRRDESDLSEISDGLQRDSSGMMLMPLNSQASRLKSVVQRAAADASKRAELEIDRDCKVPAAAMDKLMPVFEHILRNSIAHGLESDRAAAGKPELGNITISHSKTGIEAGGVVNISIRDDGAGINHDRVLAIAVQRGLVKPDKKYTPRDIREFIFAAGFSTAEKVTQLSGRGVGLDVVRDTVSRLGGVITLDTVQGQGTEFIITIPTDAATMAVLPVTANGVSVMLPISIIQEILPLGAGASVRVQATDQGVRVDGVDVEIVRLHHKVSASRQGLRGAGAEHKRGLTGHLIVMREGGGSKAILVDSVKMQTRVVVTSLGPFVKSIPGFIAGSVLEGGTVGLIVNPIRMADVESPISTSSEVVSGTRVSRVMIVDDSPSMRLVTSRIVKRMGYDVVTCSDGLDALNAISTGALVDAFLVDLEMPGMDGFELISQLRQKVDQKSKPIVVISSRTAEKHKQRALSLGASEYLTKPYEESALERLIDTLVARQK